ncbi:outer membrane protein assembly factor BamE [Sandarakinorhabdus rubra]|uniref:outer membrane protein assembly factor BamE n=1 Tax=Sandarakinorhabdus rubra TaxID=2672568 RepID=UPI0013DD84E7|nr:outer membrane protein assembly factor BamE [Sandarakinorhabdus rubra]
MTRPLFLALMTAAALMSAGCSRIKASQGYLIDETLFTSILPGVDNRESVSRTLGRPTFAGQFQAGSWYYVSRLTGQYAFVAPKTLQQQILIVSFDDAGNVSKVERRGMEKIADINPVGDKTPTLGREEGFFADLFGNIGAVGAAGGPLGGVPTGRDGPR